MHIDNKSEIIDFHFGKAFIAQHTGIIDQHINAAISVHGLLNHIVDTGIVGHAGAIGDGFATGFFDFSDHGFCRLGRAARTVHSAAQIIDHDFCTSASKFQRMALAKTAACSGYDDHLIGKIQTHNESPPKKKSALLCMMGLKGSRRFQRLSQVRLLCRSKAVGGQSGGLGQ